MKPKNIFAVLFATAILIMSLYILLGFSIGPSLDARSAELQPSAQNWIDTNIPKVAADWSINEYYSLTSTNFQKSITEEEAEEVLRQYANSLGK